MAALVKGLPEALQRQYEYEDPIVRGGKHLLHSPFFKVHKDKHINIISKRDFVHKDHLSCISVDLDYYLLCGGDPSY